MIFEKADTASLLNMPIQPSHISMSSVGGICHILNILFVYAGEDGDFT